MSAPFELPAELTIYSALETRDALLAWLNDHTATSTSDRVVEISAKDVVEVDGSGLQLLAALSNMDVSWRLAHTSAVFSEACRTLGLGHWIDSRHLKSEA